MKNHIARISLIIWIWFLIGINPLSLLISGGSTFTNIIYVDDNANPSWYDATHVKTICEAITNASEGDTIFVFNGTYYENITISKSLNLIGEEPHTTIIDGFHQGDVITIETNNVTVSRFTIQNGTDNTIWERYAIKIKNNSTGPISHLNNFTISNCIITGNRGGILLHNVTDCHILSCILYNNIGSIIIRSHSDNIFIDNTTVYHNGKKINENSYYSGGVTVDGYSELCTNFVLTNCDIYENIGIGLELSGVHNILVDHSLISDSSWFGIILGKRVKNITICHNNIIGNKCNGIYIIDDFVNLKFLRTIDNILIHNNTIANNGGGVLPDDANGGIFFYNCINNIQIINNNITSNFKYGIYFAHSRNNHILNNNFINNTNPAFFYSTPLWNNKWKGNYWDNWIGFGPKIIRGKLGILPWFNFDWHPASNPFEIS